MADYIIYLLCKHKDMPASHNTIMEKTCYLCYLMIDLLRLMHYITIFFQDMLINHKNNLLRELTQEKCKLKQRVRYYPRLSGNTRQFMILSF